MNPRTRQVLRGLWEAMWRYRRRTMLAMSLLVLAKVAAVGVPMLLKAIVDRFSEPASLSAGVSAGATAALPGGVQAVMVLPVFLLLGYALLRFAGTLFTELRDLVFARVSLRTVTDYAERTFAHLLALNPRFHVQRNTGSLIRDLERGTRGIGFLLGAGLFTAVPTLVELVAVLVVLSAGYSLWFTLIVIVTSLFYAAYTMTLTHRRAVRQRRVNEIDSHANGRMVDSLLNYETVKTYAREHFEQRRYSGVLADWVEQSVHNQKALSLLHVGQSAIIAGGVALVMLLAGEQTVRGEMTVGDLVLVNAYIIQICLPLNALGFVFREARDALVNTETLFSLLEHKPEVEAVPGSQPLEARGGEVVFDHVDFAYEPGRRVLHDVSFSIGAGKTVAVVGGSGSGKSTLARLLLRLYDVENGAIHIDGQDVRQVALPSLRQAIGVVPQDTVLFNDTIAYNIAYGRTGAGVAEVIEAAKAAQVHEFILSLPQQYDTVVGERGLKLSGGEKQRIAIARAFLKNPPLMVFDEATSALDTRAERAIQSQLDRIAEGRTTLVIAHRLSTIVNADQIIVLDQGRIVEQGRHEELLRREGLYAQLWALQLQQQQVERLERELARQPINLAVLLAGVVDGLRSEMEARGVDLFSAVDTDSGRVSGDPTTLSQVVAVLLLSAVQATPAGGRIELRLARRDEQAQLSIASGRHASGPVPVLVALDGMRLPRDGDTPPDPLVLRSLIERQGGRFSVEPPSAAHGVRYVLELPLMAVDVDALPPRPAAEREGALPNTPLSGVRVMCIDDRDDALDALVALLEPEGAQVIGFTIGRDAVAWLEHHDQSLWPQVLVCDIALADEDGHQVVRKLRQLEVQRGLPLERRVPAVALTGLAQPGDRVQALMAGFQVHLAKPVDPQELVSTIFTLAGRAGQGTAAPVLPLAGPT